MSTDIVLRLARTISPRDSRERRFEEWRADVAGCSEVGLSSAGIAVGALRLASAARAGLLASLLARALMRSRTVAIGVVLGAACAVCAVPVPAVVALAVLLQGTAYAAARRSSRTGRRQPRRVEISG